MSKQSIRVTVLWIGVVLVVLMCLCPPWVRISLDEHGPKGSRRSVASRCLWFREPKADNYVYNYRVDFERLLLQVSAVVLLTGMAVYTIGSPNGKQQT